MTDVSVVSATRHEAGNVGPLVARIEAALGPTGLTWELIFVDDSDDDTPDAILAVARAGYPIEMLHRPTPHRRGGLSGALTLGLRHVRSPLCVVIDADLQHPPELLPELIRPLQSGAAPLTIASRYVAGGSASGLAGPFRHSVSRAATCLVQILFAPVRRIKDPVSGYFALRTEILQSVELRPEGFKMLVEILVRTGAPAVEVPYHFAGRVGGVSKVNLKLGLYFLRHVLRLWLETTAPWPLRGRGRPNPAHPEGVVLTLSEYAADQETRH